MSNTTVAIVGAGFSGSVLAIQLLHHGAPNLRVDLIEQPVHFRNIKGGEPALSAVSAAQRALLKTGYNSGNFSFSRSNPFFWAPFVYVGD